MSVFNAIPWAPVYVHPTTAGNKHIPAGGSPGQALLNSADGTAVWGTVSTETYVHPTTAGNKHIPAGGSAGQILRWSADGTAVWGADTDTIYTHPTTDGNLHVPATGTTNSGKVLTAGATAGVFSWQTPTIYTHPTTSGNNHIPSGGSSGQILRWSSDGVAVWGTDNDTVYTHPTTAGNKHIPTGGAAGQILGYGGASGEAQWIAAPSAGVGGTSTFNSTTGRTITHNLGHQNYHVDVMPTAATGGLVGEIYVVKANNTVTIHCTGPTTTVPLTYYITPY